MSVKKIGGKGYEVSQYLGLAEMARFRRRYRTKKVAKQIDDRLRAAIFLGERVLRDVLKDLTRLRSQSQKDESGVRRLREIALVKDLADIYYQRYCKRHNRDKVNKRYRLKLIAQNLGELPITDIRPLDFDDYIDRRRESGVVAATINRELAVARHMFGWAFKKRLIRSNPAEMIEMLEEKRRPVGHVDEAAIQAVFAQLAPVYSDGVFRFIYETGCRKGEALHLLWEDLDFEMRVAIARKTKPGNDRFLPLTRGAIEAVQVQPRIGPFVFYSEITNKPYGDIRKPWATARRKAGHPNLTIKDLRTAFANRMADQYGVKSKEIAILMGHFDDSTTKAHYLEDRTAQNIRRILKVVEGGRR